VAEPWDAREDGAALLAAVTRAIADERAKAAGEHRPLRDADLARAVLRSPALQDANRRILNAAMAEAEPAAKAAIRSAAMEQFGDIVRVAVDEQMSARLAEVEAAVRADEREKIRLAVRQSCACGSCKSFIAGLIGEPVKDGSDEKGPGHD